MALGSLPCLAFMGRQELMGGLQSTHHAHGITARLPRSSHHSVGDTSLASPWLEVGGTLMFQGELPRMRGP